MSRAAPSTSPSDPETLKSLLTSIPPKTLHTYTLAHLADATPPTLAVLSAFFAALVPPPRLHCVRCHKDFIEVENTEHSCHVEHDSNIVDIDWVGGPEEYETSWGCCGSTVPGDDGDPPDGWCYEGKHTTDIKRARFRADADYTDEEDTHVSCLELNCHGKAKPKSKAAGKGKGKGKAKANDSGAEDGESSVGRARSVKSATTPKRRGRPPKGKEATDGKTDGEGKPRKKRKVVSSA